MLSFLQLPVSPFLVDDSFPLMSKGGGVSYDLLQFVLRHHRGEEYRSCANEHNEFISGHGYCPKCFVVEFPDYEKGPLGVSYVDKVNPVSVAKVLFPSANIASVKSGTWIPLNRARLVVAVADAINPDYKYTGGDDYFLTVASVALELCKFYQWYDQTDPDSGYMPNLTAKRIEHIKESVANAMTNIDFSRRKIISKMFCQSLVPPVPQLNNQYKVIFGENLAISPATPVAVLGEEMEAVAQNVIPEVGQLWECTQNVMAPYDNNPNFYKHRLTIGKLYRLKKTNEYQWLIDDDNGHEVAFDFDGRNHVNPLELSDYFRFHSDPNEKPEPKKRDFEKEFHELFEAAKKEDSDFALKLIPLSNQFEPGYASNYSEPNVTMVSDPTQPSPELLDAYNLLSSEGKKEMWQKHPTIKWPEVKEYVNEREFAEYLKVMYQTGRDYVFMYKNCRPEIDEEKGEIRFVKV